MNQLQEIALMPALRLARLIRRGDLSPVQVVKACLNQIEEFNPRVNALVTLSPSLLEDARKAEEKLLRGDDIGPLHGVPVGIKDITPVAGLRTTYGSVPYADHIAVEDALVVGRLRQAGAIIVGKTNTSEFAAGANTVNDLFGPTRNPWNPDLTVGGSTGGGAAGLVTGMFALAEGTDLGGSLRIPAAFCGVAGLRPTPGLVPTYPSEYLWDSLSVTGPMARTVEDLALMLQVISGPSDLAILTQPVESRDFQRAVRTEETSLTLAYAPDPTGIGIDPLLQECCQQAVADLGGAGLTVEQVELDLSFFRKTFALLRSHWMICHHIGRLNQIDSFGPNLAGNILEGLRLKPQELAEAEQARNRLWHDFRIFFQKYAALLTPTTALSPFRVEADHPDIVSGKKMRSYIDWAAPTSVLSLTGLPVASVPCGKDRRGLPVGIQIVGPARNEERVLRIGRAIQKSVATGLPPILAEKDG